MIQSVRPNANYDKFCLKNVHPLKRLCDYCVFKFKSGSKKMIARFLNDVALKKEGGSKIKASGASNLARGKFISLFSHFSSLSTKIHLSSEKRILKQSKK